MNEQKEALEEIVKEIGINNTVELLYLIMCNADDTYKAKILYNTTVKFNLFDSVKSK